MKKKLLLAAVLFCTCIASIFIYIAKSGSTHHAEDKNTAKSKAIFSKKAIEPSKNDFHKTIISNSSPLGNTPSNLAKNGFIAVSGNYSFMSFFPFLNSPSSIYRSFSDGVTSSIKIVPSKKNSIYDDFNIRKQWLYFLDYNSKIYRCKTNGDNLGVFLDENCKSFTICKNYIFYLRADGTLYRAYLNNPKIKTKIDNRVQYFTLSDNGKKLFYTKIDYSEIRFYKSNALGLYLAKKEYYSLASENMIPYIYYNGYIYFLPLLNANMHIPLIKNSKTIYRLKVTGTNKIEPFYKNENVVYDIHLSNSKLFFADANNTKSMNLNTRKLSFLNMPPVSLIYIAGNKLFGLSLSYNYSNNNRINSSKLYIYDIKKKHFILDTINSRSLAAFDN